MKSSISHSLRRTGLPKDSLQHLKELIGRQPIYLPRTLSFRREPVTSANRFNFELPALKGIRRLGDLGIAPALSNTSSLFHLTLSVQQGVDHVGVVKSWPAAADASEAALVPLLIIFAAQASSAVEGQGAYAVLGDAHLVQVPLQAHPCGASPKAGSPKQSVAVVVRRNAPAKEPMSVSSSIVFLMWEAPDVVPRHLRSAVGDTPPCDPQTSGDRWQGMGQNEESAPVLWGHMSLCSLAQSWPATQQQRCEVELQCGLLQQEAREGRPRLLLRRSPQPSWLQAPVVLHVGVESALLLAGGRNPARTLNSSWEQPFNGGRDLHSGRVAFRLWRSDHVTCRTEVTSNFQCALCLELCGSYEGVRLHLEASHGSLQYTFSWTGLGLLPKHCVVPIVSVLWTQEAHEDDLEDTWPKTDFCFIARKRRRMDREARAAPWAITEENICGALNQSAMPPGHLSSDSLSGDAPPSGSPHQQDLSKPLASVSGNSTPQPSLPGDALKDASDALKDASDALKDTSDALKDTSDALKDASDALKDASDALKDASDALKDTSDASPTDIMRRRKLLKSQMPDFFHSQTGQPMVEDEALCAEDSEDEVSATVCDLEEVHLLEEFVDVSMEEKWLMQQWNSFVRRHRILADRHCAWACHSFARLHAPIMATRPALRRGFMLFLVKLWRYNLVDSVAVASCLHIIDGPTPSHLSTACTGAARVCMIPER